MQCLIPYINICTSFPLNRCSSPAVVSVKECLTEPSSGSVESAIIIMLDNSAVQAVMYMQMHVHREPRGEVSSTFKLNTTTLR